jgi:hypothetical protein
MDLPREVARTLHPNEAVRLHCHGWCPDAKACSGLEASMLEKLRLFEKSGDGYKRSNLGEAVSNHVTISNDTSAAPVLKERRWQT